MLSLIEIACSVWLWKHLRWSGVWHRNCCCYVSLEMEEKEEEKSANNHQHHNMIVQSPIYMNRAKNFIFWDKLTHFILYRTQIPVVSSQQLWDLYAQRLTWTFLAVRAGILLWALCGGPCAAAEKGAPPALLLPAQRWQRLLTLKPGLASRLLLLKHPDVPHSSWQW